VLAQSANQNFSVVTHQISQEAVSVPINPTNNMGQKGLFDDFDRELMGKIMAKVTKKLKRS